jgi:group I intron endonuclease
MRHFGYIYQTTNLINGKVYIGQATKFDDGYLGSGRLITKAIQKYGRQNFSKRIIKYYGSRAELNEEEIRWIARKRKTLGTDRVYNLTSGGNFRDGFSHSLSEEAKRKIAISKLGTKLSKEHREAISKTLSRNLRGKPHHRIWVRNQAKSLMKKVKVVAVKTGEELHFESRKECWTYFSKLLSTPYSTIRWRTLNNRIEGYTFLF